jgi:hypothetical protein
VDVQRQLALSLIEVGIPVFGPSLVRIYSERSNEVEHRRIDDILDYLCEGLNKQKMMLQPPVLESLVRETIKKLCTLENPQEPISEFSFRKWDYVIEIVKKMNLGSREGLRHDPDLECCELVDLFRSIGAKEPKKLLKMSVYELVEQDLVEKLHFGKDVEGLDYTSIGPSDSFFFKTDLLFQNWSPQKDAQEAIRLVSQEKNGTILCESLMNKFHWSIRRMNSVLKFMEHNGLIDTLDSSPYSQVVGGGYLWDDWLTLTDKSDFFISEDEADGDSLHQ